MPLILSVFILIDQTFFYMLRYFSCSVLNCKIYPNLPVPQGKYIFEIIMSVHHTFMFITSIKPNLCLNHLVYSKVLTFLMCYTVFRDELLIRKTKNVTYNRNCQLHTYVNANVVHMCGYAPMWLIILDSSENANI